MRTALALLGAASLLTLSCVGASMVGPSPVILPDAATVQIGDGQIFTVMNATVVRFTLVGDRQDASACVEIDPAFSRADGIRLIARRVCRRPVYLSANIGEGRSPLVAVMQVE